MFILRDKEITIPDQIEKNNANIMSIKDMMNELFGISFLELDPNAGLGFSWIGRASFLFICSVS